MPTRFVTIGIVAFWLAASAWFVARDLLPQWRMGDAPPFTIELADEAVQQALAVRWQIRRNGQKIGELRTTLRAHEPDDTYELHAVCTELPLVDVTLPGLGPVRISIRNYDDRLRVTRDGELRAMSTEVDLVVRAGAGPPVTARAEFGAELRGPRLERRFRLASPVLGEFAPVLESRPPIRGSVLNPLHPVHRISNLRFGQHWRQPLVTPHEDVVQEALRRFAPASPGVATPGLWARNEEKARWLDARVRDAPVILERDRGEVECFVIDYTGDWQGDDFIARTWVRRSDGAVLLQEAESQNQRLTLERE